MRNLLLAIGVVLTVYASIPYLLDVLRHKTKPRVVSWFNWSLLAGISAAATLADKQYPATALGLAIFVECSLVVIAGLKLGDKKFELFDVFCQAGAIIGFVLWIAFNSPLIAVAANCAIDLIASMPTFRHIWHRPHEETASAFVFSAIGAAFVLAAVHDPRASGLVGPIFIICINVFTASLFFMSPNRLKKAYTNR